jgi:hypothetical protein
VLLRFSMFFHTLINRNNADLGKGVPRNHVFHGSWELLFFLFLDADREMIGHRHAVSIPQSLKNCADAVLVEPACRADLRARQAAGNQIRTFPSQYY